MFVWKLWAREKFCSNDSNKISKFNIEGYIYMFHHSQLCNRYIQLQHRFACSYAKLWTYEKLCMYDSNNISNSIFKAIYTGSIIVSYEIGKFSRNIFLHVRMQNYELVKNCARMIQTRSQIQYLRLFILLQF